MRLRLETRDKIQQQKPDFEIENHFTNDDINKNVIDLELDKNDLDQIVAKLEQIENGVLLSH